MEEGLLEKTGKSLDEWSLIIASSGKQRHGEIINYLKDEHGMTHGFANFVAHKHKGSDAGSIDDGILFENQYKGKESLLPIYAKLKESITAFGKDITIAPKKDSVSYIRKKQFALIKPATKTRIDLGLKIKGKGNEGRLEDSGPFGTMCTHRVQIEKPEDIDPQLIAWIREAYEGAG